MKSIGVYGDSFAGAHTSTNHKETHWSFLLANYYNTNITNYSEPGSSIYFSYKEFLKHYDKHDLNIFCVTEYTRYHSKVTTAFGEQFVGGISGCSESVLPTPETLLGWFICQTDEHSLDMTTLMLDKVRTLDNAIILVPNFSTYRLKEPGLDYTTTLFNLMSLQLSIFGISDFTEFSKKYAEGDLITGHLTPEFNQIFFLMLKDRIESGIWNWKIPEKINLKYTFEHYYKRRN